MATREEIQKKTDSWTLGEAREMGGGLQIRELQGSKTSKDPELEDRKVQLRTQEWCTLDYLALGYLVERLALAEDRLFPPYLLKKNGKPYDGGRRLIAYLADVLLHGAEHAYQVHVLDYQNRNR